MIIVISRFLFRIVILIVILVLIFQIIVSWYRYDKNVWFIPKTNTVKVIYLWKQDKDFIYFNKTLIEIRKNNPLIIDWLDDGCYNISLINDRRFFCVNNKDYLKIAFINTKPTIKKTYFIKDLNSISFESIKDSFVDYSFKWHKINWKHYNNWDLVYFDDLWWHKILNFKWQIIWWSENKLYFVENNKLYQVDFSFNEKEKIYNKILRTIFEK